MQVHVISKTHGASSRAGGVTADYWVRRHVLHGSCSAEVVWVDEISQVDIGILCQFNKLCWTKVRWILSGDFNQFGAIFNSFRGTSLPGNAFQDTALLHRLAGGNRVTLTNCRRSDEVLFKFYSSLLHDTSSLEEQLQAARDRFQFAGPARWNLVISHRKRLKLNKELNLLYKPAAGAVFLRVKPHKGQMNVAQNMYVWKGIQLIGSTASERKGIKTAFCIQLQKYTKTVLSSMAIYQLPSTKSSNC